MLMHKQGGGQFQQSQAIKNSKVGSSETTPSAATMSASSPLASASGDRHVDEKRLAKLAGMFSQIDLDSSGSIDRHELRDYFRKLGIRVTRQEMDDLISKIDNNSNGQIEFHEFVDLMTLQKLKTVFEELDTDSSGYLDRDEVAGAFDQLGLQLNDKQIDEILASIDSNGDSQIDYEEFQAAFEAIPYADFGKIAQHWCRQMAFDTGNELQPAQPVPNLDVFCAGALGGIIARTIIAPLSLVTIRSQTTNSGSSFQIFREVIRQTGFRGLFKGNLMTVLRIVPFGGLVGIVYRNLLKRMPKVSKHWEPGKRLVAGGVAGMVATVPLYPLDLMRAKLSVNNFKVSDVLRQISKESGFRGFYKGLSPTLQAVVPFVACQQTTYDMLKKHSEKTNLEPNVKLFFGFGVVAGLIAQTLVHPFDLIRRRSQVEASNKGKSRMWTTMKSVVRSNGYRGLFRGLGPSCMKIIPAVSISLTVRDLTLDHLEFR